MQPQTPAQQYPGYPFYPPAPTYYPPQQGQPAAVYPPGIAPPVPGAYPAPPTAAPMPTQPAPTMPGGDQFNAPERVVNVVRPRIMDIGPGRLLLLSPTKIERDVKNDLDPDPNATQDRLTADVVVLDGPPFPYGGKPEKGIPHTHMSQPPQEWPGLWLSQDLIVRQCEKSIGGKVLGRLVRGQASDPKRNAPWRLDDPTEEDKALARQYLAGVAVAAATAPAPVAPPAVNAPPAGYPGYPVGMAAPAPASVPPVPPAAPGSYPPPGYPVNAAPAMVYDPATGQWTTPAAQVAQQYIGNPDPGAQYQPAPVAPQVAAQPTAYPPPPMTPPGVDINTPPPGMDPNVWASMPPEHRAAVAASAAGRAPWQ